MRIGSEQGASSPGSTSSSDNTASTDASSDEPSTEQDSGDNGGTFGDIAEDLADDNEESVSVGGSEVDTPDERVETPTSSSGSSGSNDSGDSFGDIAEDLADDDEESISVGDSEIDTPDEKPDTPSTSSSSDGGLSSSGYQEGATTTISGVEYVVRDGELERANMTSSVEPVDDLSELNPSGAPQNGSVGRESVINAGAQGTVGESITGDTGGNGSGIVDRAREATETAAEYADPAINTITEFGDRTGDTVDSELRDRTGGEDDLLETEVGLSDDFTSTEDSGGVRNTVDTLTEPVQEAGREFNEARQTEGEQFGDFDLSFGLGGEGDEVEQFTESLQERGAAAGRDLGQALFDEEGGAFRSESLGSRALEAAGRDDLAESYESGIRRFGSGGLERLGEGAGSIPQLGVEAGETLAFTASNPGEAVGKTPDAAAGAAVATAEDFQQNPAEATGGLVFGSAAGVGATRAVGKARTARRQGSLARERGARTETPTRESRTPIGDNRAQGTLGDLIPDRRRSRDRGDSDSSSSGGSSESLLPDNIDDMLDNFERGTRVREAEARAERSFIDEMLEAGRKQERGDEPKTVDTRPGGDYTAPSPGGDYVASRAPDTSRSGPTSAQSAGRSGLDTDLSPRESQLAATLGRETPNLDLRGLDSTRRRTPQTDLRAQAGSSSSGTRSAGLAGAAVGADPVQEMGDLRDQAETPGVAGDESAPESDGGLLNITDIGGGTTGVEPGVQEPSDDLPETPGPTVSGPTTGTGTNVGSNTGTSTGQTPDSNADSATDTGIDVGTVPEVGAGTDTESGTDTASRPDTDVGVPPIVDTRPGTPERTRDPERPRRPNRPRSPGRPRDPDRPRRPNRPRAPERPRDPDRPRRIRTPDLDLGADNRKDDEELFGTATATYSFDFGDPLTGETIETDDESDTNGIPGLGNL